MAAEIGDVAAAGTIESAWGNQIRDRAVMRYASSAARDSAETGPTEGRICYLEDANDLQIYNGSGWVSMLSADGTVTATGNLPMGSNKVTGLAAASAAGDAVRYEQAVLRSNVQVANGSAAGPTLINWGSSNWWTGDSSPAGSLCSANLTGLTTGEDYLLMARGTVSYRKTGSSGTARAQLTRLRWDYNDGADSLGGFSRMQCSTDGYYKSVTVFANFSASSITGATIRVHLLQQNDGANSVDYTFSQASVSVVGMQL